LLGAGGGRGARGCVLLGLLLLLLGAAALHTIPPARVRVCVCVC
jgi:hypothetical protein